MAIQLLELMSSRLVQPKLISFNAALSACGQHGPWATTLALLEASCQAMLEPDAYSLAAAVGACAAGQELSSKGQVLHFNMNKYYLCNHITT